MRNIIIGTIAALGLASTPAIAQSTIGGGAAVSGPAGSAAGGVTAGTARNDSGKKHRGHRAERAGARTGTANSSSTHGSGSVYTDRHRATGAVTTGGTASGTGSQSSSSAVDAYGSTDRNGSTGEVYGDSSATSTNPGR